VFKSFEIKDDESRLSKVFESALDYKKDPNMKLNIWEILKNAIGKDLTKFAVPV